MWQWVVVGITAIVLADIVGRHGDGQGFAVIMSPVSGTPAHTGQGHGVVAGLMFINAVFTYRQRSERLEEVQYDSWRKYQRTLAKQQREASGDATGLEGGPSGDGPAPPDGVATAQDIRVTAQAQVSSSQAQATRRRQRQEPVDHISEQSDETDASDLDADDGLAARVWDDLVDMEKFWTHAALAVVELLLGTGALVAVASSLGAPTLRDKLLTVVAMAMFLASLHSLTLPMQWTCPVARVSGTPEERMSESDETTATRVYHWGLALQYPLGIASPPEPLHQGLHRALACLQVVIVWASAVVYPMDWGRPYQAWPLPTVYATVAAFLLCQSAAVICWHFMPRNSKGAGSQ
eukprot:jgi/Ulvmu1/9776/UM056_0016.1